MMPSFTKAALALSLIVSLTACGGVLPKPKDAPRQYTISGANTTMPKATSQFGALEVQRPTAAPGLDTERVANQTSPYRLEYLADARWAASAPSLLQNALVESFARSGAFAAVASDEASMQAVNILAIDLQSFQLVSQSGGNAVQLRLNARIMAVPSREVLKMQNFEISEPVSELNMEAVAAAFQAAYDKLAPSLLETTLSTLRAQADAAAMEAAKTKSHKKR